VKPFLPRRAGAADGTRRMKPKITELMIAEPDIAL
jgi:hypothetical protein